MRAILSRLTLVAVAGLAVSGCGGSSTDTVDNSELTELNGAGMMEGTVNDASAMDVATDTNVSNAMDNAVSDAANASDNATESNSAE